MKEEINMEQRGGVCMERVEEDEDMLKERDRKRPYYRMREEETETSQRSTKATLYPPDQNDLYYL